MASRSCLAAVKGASRVTALARPGATNIARSFRTSPQLCGGYSPLDQADIPAAEPSAAPFSEPVGINPADASKSINTPMHQYGQYLTTCLPKYIQQFSVYKDELTLYVAPTGLLQTLTFLRDHSQCQYKSVMDITAVDFPTKPMRFEVSQGHWAGVDGRLYTTCYR